MEEQIVSLYSTLKANRYKNITVSYYSHPNRYKIEKFKLLDVEGFSTITVCNPKICTELYFFSEITLIESITIAGDNTPIYFNPYAKEFVEEENIKKTEIIKRIKEKFLSSTNINQIITPRETFLIRYFNNKCHHFNDLFFSKKQKVQFKKVFNILKKEVVNYAKIHGFDPTIKPIGGGSTSFVYSIGDKIIKIGKPRKNTTIPYCEYLLQPIINKDFTFDGIPMHIEVTQKVATYMDLGSEWYHKFNEEISKLQKQLRAIGLRCSDLHKGNIGILTQDNIIHFDPLPFQTGSESDTSITNNNSLVVRKKGDFVIIDLDYIKIVNVKKYCRYLARIGYDTEKIAEIKDSYSGKTKKR